MQPLGTRGVRQASRLEERCASDVYNIGLAVDNSYTAAYNSFTVKWKFTMVLQLFKIVIQFL